MHYIRAPLVLLAMTFVTAVLATPLIRRDSLVFVKLSDAFNQTNLAVQTVNRDLQTISSTTGQSGAPELITDFSFALARMDGIPFFVASFNGTVSDDDSQRLVNGSVIPLFVTINETVNSLIQQQNFISTNFNDFDTNTVAGMVSNMLTNTDLLLGAVGDVFASDALKQLVPVALSLVSVTSG